MTSEYQYHFYRCKNCKTLLTADQEQEAYKTGKLCECGGVKYYPTNPTNAEWDSQKVTDYCSLHDLQRDPAEA